MERITRYRYFGRGVLNAYSQVFFSENPYSAILILLATFLVPGAGLAGLLGVVISILLASWFGQDKSVISKGILSYNVLLVTLPVGLYFKIGMAWMLTVIFASILTFFITIALKGWSAKQRIPFLSWPFLIGLWVIMLAISQFSALEISDASIFEWNRLYDAGGITLVRGVEWLNQLPIPDSVKTYLASMGAVYFQYSLIGGLMVSIAVLIYSRIAFTLSLLGFFSALFFYQLIGLDINSLNYSYIGFNFILTAIAIGGFYLVPSWASFTWTILLVPLVTFLIVSTEQIFSKFGLSVYALPFNLVVPLFLFVLQYRVKPSKSLNPVMVQHGSPEKNLYAVVNYRERLSRQTWFRFRLPVMGKWTISQGHNGPVTHQGDWRHAWDFVQTGKDGKTWSGAGVALEDFFCYNKPVLAVADGWIDSVTDGIEDNGPGDTNTRQNWGNTVIIKHAEFLYSKYAHLKRHSLKVRQGDYVVAGQEIGLAGNSGRSPEPHLHFQFQETPWIDSATVDYPFGYYLTEEQDQTTFRSFERPKEGDLLSNPDLNPMLKKVFHLIPGQKIRVQFADQDGEKQDTWMVHTDIFNNSFLSGERGSRAWFVNDGQVFYFTHYEGSKSDPLYRFFTALFKVPLLHHPNIRIADSIPLFTSARRWMRWFQDWVAPFYIFLHTRYELSYLKSDDPLDPQELKLKTSLRRQISDDLLDGFESDITFTKAGVIHMDFTGDHGITSMKIFF